MIPTKGVGVHMEGSGQGSGQRIWYFLYLFVVFEFAKTDMKGVKVEVYIIRRGCKSIRSV